MSTTTDNLTALAEEIAHETELTEKQALVIAGERAGLDDAEIGRLIGRSDATVERIRSTLRQKERELPDEISRRERTLDILRDR